MDAEAARSGDGLAAGRFVVAGVAPGQSDKVAIAAARFARLLGAELVCAHVDAMRYSVREDIDGTVVSLPVDPDVEDDDVDEFDEELHRFLSGLFAGSSLRWSTRTLAGDPAVALSRLAETLDAEAIVVGTRKGGFRSSVQEFFGGSVAVHLAHRQARPVIVIPVGGEPRTATGSILMPWAPGE